MLTDAPDIPANDMLTAKNMAEVLHRHYPGHLWGVNCDGRTGMIYIRNLSLSGEMGFKLKMPDIYSASDLDKEVMRAGGEILERYRLSRGKFDAAQHAGLKQDFAGRIHHD